MSKRIEKVINELIDQYTHADTSDRPWIIGFSGGKDSTVLLTLVWRALEKIKKVFLYGSGKEIVPVSIRIRGRMHTVEKPFEGIIPHLERRYRETESDSVRERLSKLMVPMLCPACKGKRL